VPFSSVKPPLSVGLTLEFEWDPTITKLVSEGADPLEVTIRGAPRLNVALREVGLGVENNGVGGALDPLRTRIELD
jgi:hypothetical protein